MVQPGNIRSSYTSNDRYDGYNRDYRYVNTYDKKPSGATYPKYFTANDQKQFDDNYIGEVQVGVQCQVQSMKISS